MLLTISTHLHCVTVGLKVKFNICRSPQLQHFVFVEINQSVEVLTFHAAWPHHKFVDDVKCQQDGNINDKFAQFPRHFTS